VTRLTVFQLAVELGAFPEELIREHEVNRITMARDLADAPNLAQAFVNVSQGIHLLDLLAAPLGGEAAKRAIDPFAGRVLDLCNLIRQCSKEAGATQEALSQPRH